ncbi:MAG: hypothetical protein J6D45_01675 [Clostridia bacterium]|nr:hypothetical protein [Clostridia bacterium]
MRNKYTAALVGSSRVNSTINSLAEYGYRVFTLPENDLLDHAVSSHADLSTFIMKNTLIVSNGYYRSNRELIDEICDFASLSLLVSNTSSRSPYPNDVGFCALNVSDKAVIANEKYLAPEIRSLCVERSLPVIHTAQGYAKCTALAFNGCLISADHSTLNAAKKIGLRTLEISSGGIDLPGYNYGFIGGACGFDGKNIYFCGDIDTHPDANRIKEFAEENRVGIVSLGRHRLYDVGSIFFV